MLPISVANELRHSRPVPAKKYDCVTLLFSGIVGFGAYCAAHTDSSGAMKIVNMLNQLYTAFDVLTDPKKNPNVYKVRILRAVDLHRRVKPEVRIHESFIDPACFSRALSTARRKFLRSVTRGVYGNTLMHG